MSIFPIGARVGADTSAFVSAMGAASGSLRAFAGSAGLASSGLAAFAGAAVMGAAVNAAREYQAELIKLNTLVGIQTEQIEEWDGAIREISKSTGQVPADLARAMFAITSGGARGTEALSILEQAAKAGAIGLGDMTSIGRTATAMLQAFGDQGLTAERAIDILVATVREGNLEASSLAGAFSRVLGPAAALGASIEDLGAFMATFTRLGGSTEQAATGLLNVMNLLIAPPAQAREKMEELGVSIERLRDIVRTDGLTAALIELNDAIGGNIDSLGEVVPNTRAMIGILNTAGLQAEEFKKDLEEMRGSVGATNQSFETWGSSADATFKSFRAELTATAIALGEVFLPPLRLVLETLQLLLRPLQLAAEGWGMLTGDMKRAAQEATEFFFSLGSGSENVDRAARNVANLTARFEDLSDENLAIIQAQLAARVQTLNEAVARGGEIAERALKQRDDEVVLLAAVNGEIQRRIHGERELTAEVEARAVATQELSEEELERLDNIQQILLGLEEQRVREEEGEFAVVKRQLAMLGANEAAIEYARRLFEAAEAARAQARAETESARAIEQAREAREREARRLREEQRRAAERAAEAARRAAERDEFLRVQNEIREITRVSTEMAESVAAAFGAVIDGTKSVADAFRDMVTDILQQLQRLAIQKALIEPLVGAAVGVFSPQARFSSSEVSAGQFLQRASQIPGNPSFNPRFSVASAKGPGGQAPAPVIVQQTFEFSPSFLDSRDGARWLRENSSEIMMIVGEGAQRSTEFARSLRGHDG